MDDQRATEMRILRLPAVLRMTGLSKSTVYRNAKAGKFPKPLVCAARASGWLESEIIEFLRARSRARSTSPETDNCPKAPQGGGANDAPDRPETAAR